MGMLKHYLEKIPPLCSDERFGQEAVEWAIFSGHVLLGYDLQADLTRIMGPPGQPERGEYDAICAAYRAYVAQTEAAVEVPELELLAP